MIPSRLLSRIGLAVEPLMQKLAVDGIVAAQAVTCSQFMTGARSMQRAGSQIISSHSCFSVTPAASCPDNHFTAPCLALPARPFSTTTSNPQAQPNTSPKAETSSQVDSKITLAAYHLGRELDIRAAAEEKGTTHALEADVCTVWVPEIHDSTVVYEPGQKSVTLPTKCMVLYPFGSVVFFGFSTHEQATWKDRLMPHVTEPVQTGPETLRVEVRPEQKEWVEKVPDVIRLKRLDMATTRILGLVLAQSVALDTYTSKVKEAMNRTSVLMEELKRSLSPTAPMLWAQSARKRAAKRQELQRLMVMNSLIYMRVISNLGVLDYSPLAWRQDRYYDVWKTLQDEFDIAYRVGSLELKVGPIQENAKFLLQLDHTKQSERSEQTIINLIMLEVLLTVLGICRHSIHGWWEYMFG